MTSNIHVGSCNLLVKLREIKFWCSRKFASQNFSLVAICRSSSMQNLKFFLIFGLKTFYSITVQISKLVNLNSIFFWEFSLCVTYVKTFAGVPDHICTVCNRWTLLTFSQKSVSEMLMYQLANNLKYLIGCWISHDFTFKNVLIWFVISRTCELKMSFWFSLSLFSSANFYKNVNIGKYYKYKYL